MMSDIEMMLKMDMEAQLKFARNKIEELKSRVEELKRENDRLTSLLSGDNEMMNSLKTAGD